MSNNNYAPSPNQDHDPLAIPEFLDRRRRGVAENCVAALEAVRASAVDAVMVGSPCPGRSLSPDFTSSAALAAVAEMRPDPEAMHRHVLALFGAATEGQIELAWIKQGKGAGAGLFQLDCIDALSEQAVKWNMEGRNIYIGATLKHPHTAPFGRTSDSDAFSCWAYWLDIDDAGAVERAQALTRQFPPTLKITTGTVPHLRQHWWWRLDAAVMDMEAVRARIAKLAGRFGGDTSVHNPGRIMRLGGSIAWPTKPGRVAQLVTVTTTGRAYSNDEIDYHAAQVTGPTRIETPAAPIPLATARSVTGSLGVLPPKIEDGREQYIRDTVHAVLMQLASQHGAWPTADEIIEIAAPQIERRVDLTREGRISPTNWRDELMAKCRAIVAKAEKGALGTLEDAVAAYAARQRADRASGQENGPHDLPVGDWRRDLIRAPNGRAYFNISNCITVLRHHDEVAGLFAFDEFASRRLVMRPLPGSRRVPGAYPRELDDDDLADLASWFAKNDFPLASKNTVADAVGVIVRETVIHPVRTWLDGLAWDGVERLDRWLIEYLGAADTEFVRHAGACWLISAVTRVMRPGVKADGVLILEGNQGIGKSSALRLLAGEWFGDALPPMNSKDASSYLRGSWIIELSELSAMSRADVEAIKAFLSRSEERFRPAYGRYEITVPRQCVFAGTTNQSSYLQDATGNRRFWPVTVGNVDLKRLQADRDQLLAEAVAAYRAGRQWWLPPEVETIARVEQAERVAEDAWTAHIERYIAGKEAVAVSEVATQGLGLKIEHVGRAEQNRIGGVLRLAGFERAGKFTRGEFAGCARFARGGGRPEF